MLVNYEQAGMTGTSGLIKINTLASPGAVSLDEREKNLGSCE